MTSTDFSETIRLGEHYLEQHQREDGFMPSFYWLPDHPEKTTSLDDSPFATACIAYSLSHLESKSAQQLYDKSLKYLQSQMIGPGLWQYWKQEPMPLPPDLDDISLCSYLLRDRNIHLRFGVNVPIILNNRNERGLFNTWVGVQGNNDACPVVNANVLLYLNDREETTTASNKLVDYVEGKQEWSSQYYNQPITHFHAISRALFHGANSLTGTKEALQEHLCQLSKADGSFGNELSTALACIVLINIGEYKQTMLVEATEWLNNQQKSNGSWSQQAFFVDPAGREFGSPCLTTAFCLEALMRYQQSLT